MGAIALQLDDATGITINRAGVNNQTFNSIGNMTAEASLNVWGDLKFQHSAGMREVLNGSVFDFEVRNGDTDRQIRFLAGNDSVKFLGTSDITHSDVLGSQRVKMDNNDADGVIFLSISGANICEVSSTGLHASGTATETSDETETRHNGNKQ